MTSQKIYKPLLQLLLIGLLGFALTFSAASKAQGSYVELTLQNGLRFDLPTNWQIINQSSKTTLEAAIAAKTAIPIGSSLPFAANLYDENGNTIALTNIRIFPNQTITQSEIISFDLAELDKYIKEQVVAGQKSIGNNVTHWLGTKISKIGGKLFFVSSYRRTSVIRKNTYFIVTLFRLIDANNSFTLTFSYDERHSFLLKMIQEHVVSSLRL